MMKIMITVSLILAASLLRAEVDQTWAFDVYLDDKQIGSHVFEVEREDSRTLFTSEADFKVNFLFFTAFRYEHQNTEVWVDGCLTKIDATTNNNGEKLVVEGQREQSSFDVTGKSGNQELEGCVRTFAYWQPDILNASKLLNAQTGEYETVSAKKDGEEVINVAGQQVKTDRYRLSASKGDILLWYTQENQRWVSLDAPAKGDRRIRYQARQVPSIKPSVVASNGE